mmetsp:Transcript_4307/g.13447  ORF Transcript_4307/g.13447 Transcript_4307/m.13447 type:complete len:242 (-) Transcript_4307:1-726(-)
MAQRLLAAEDSASEMAAPEGAHSPLRFSHAQHLYKPAIQHGVGPVCLHLRREERCRDSESVERRSCVACSCRGVPGLNTAQQQQGTFNRRPRPGTVLAAKRTLPRDLTVFALAGAAILILAAGKTLCLSHHGEGVTLCRFGGQVDRCPQSSLPGHRPRSGGMLLQLLGEPARRQVPEGHCKDIRPSHKVPRPAESRQPCGSSITASTPLASSAASSSWQGCLRCICHRCAGTHTCPVASEP